METTKICTKCREYKPLSEFNKNRSRRDGYQYTCKLCDSLDKLNYYRNNKEAISNRRKLSYYEKQKMMRNKKYRETHIVCTSCKETKPRIEFLTMGGKCKACIRVYNNSRYESGSAKRCRLKIKYGITLDKYHEILEDQGGVCAICGQPETQKSKEGKVLALAVDHNHKTNKIRQLLCGKCNKAIGLFKDDPEILQKATEYLKKHKEAC